MTCDVDKIRADVLDELIKHYAKDAGEDEKIQEMQKMNEELIEIN